MYLYLVSVAFAGTATLALLHEVGYTLCERMVRARRGRSDTPRRRRAADHTPETALQDPEGPGFARRIAAEAARRAAVAED